MKSCFDCICRSCMLWWSNRCPYGGCYDDYRAVHDPYDAAHPNDPPRKLWTEWNKPGEQAHWCRGGTVYIAEHCENYAPYEGQVVKTCLLSNVSVFSDGYILCPIIDTVGCQECMERFEETQRLKDA